MRVFAVLLESLAAFQHAEQCSELAVATHRKAIAELTATDTSTRSQARQIASHERAIADAERRRAEATRNITAIQRQLGTTGPAARHAAAAPWRSG